MSQVNNIFIPKGQKSNEDSVFPKSLDVIWGVDPAILVSNTLSSGHNVFLPKSRCSEPCELGAVKVRHHYHFIMIIITIIVTENE